MSPLRAKISMRWIETAVRVALGGVFVYASLDKIADPAAFAQIIANYQILPLQWTNPAALLLPWIELTCGLGLISGWLVRGGALVAGILIIIFMGALAYSIFLGVDIRCGCFSTDGTAPDNLYVDLARDAILLGIAVTVLFRANRTSTQSLEKRRLDT